MVFVVISAMPVMVVVVISLMVIAMGVHNVDMTTVLTDEAASNARYYQNAQATIQRHSSKPVRVHEDFPFSADNSESTQLSATIAAAIPAVRRSQILLA
jgi:hypothetical protein